MKKVLSAICLMTLLVVSTFSVFAAVNDSESKILEALRGGVTTQAGVTLYLPSEYANQAENYFNSPECNLTEAQEKEILENINAAKAVIAASNATSLAELNSNKEIRDQVYYYAQSAASVVGLKLVADGNLFKVVNADGSNIVVTTDNVVKTTGSNFDMTNAAVVSVSLVAVMAVTLFAARKVAVRG